MTFNVFCSQFINLIEGLGMFFSSADLVRKIRRYAATKNCKNSVSFSWIAKLKIISQIPYMSINDFHSNCVWIGPKLSLKVQIFEQSFR